MPDLCCAYTYSSVTINGDETTDTLVIDLENGAIEGLDGAPIRRQVDPLAGQDGGATQPARYGPRIITFKGAVHVGTHGSPGKHDPFVDTAGYLAKLMTLEAAIISALEAQRDSAATLAWTPANGGAHTISCLYGVPGGEIKFGGTFAEPTFEFSLLAENPTIAVA